MPHHHHVPHISGPAVQPRSGKDPKQLVILLHGWGADGPNLIDLAEPFSEVLPDAQFFSPNAPYVCEANPYGYQWFSLMDRQPQHMLEGVRGAADILNHFIDHLLEEFGLSNDKLALVGFSQGTMLALHVAMRRAPVIAGVVGFSGALIAPDVLSKEINARPPVALIHGEADDVVPYKSMQMAVEGLKGHGVTVEAHSRPFIGHSIDMEGLKVAAEFLKKRLG